MLTAAGLNAGTGATLLTNGAGNVMSRPWQAAEANALKSPSITAGVGTIALVATGDRRSAVP